MVEALSADLSVESLMQVWPFHKIMTNLKRQQTITEIWFNFEEYSQTSVQRAILGTPKSGSRWHVVVDQRLKI